MSLHLDLPPFPSGLTFIEADPRWAKIGTRRSIEKASIVIDHCTDSGRRTLPEQVHQWAIEDGSLGFPYHFLVGGKGEVYGGRDLDRVGAHCRGHNYHSVGVCHAGTLNRRLAWDGPLGFSDEQFEASILLHWWLAKALPHFDGHPDQVHGHKEFNLGKTCPDFEVGEKIMPELSIRLGWDGAPVEPSVP